MPRGIKYKKCTQSPWISISLLESLILRYLSVERGERGERKKKCEGSAVQDQQTINNRRLDWLICM